MNERLNDKNPACTFRAVHDIEEFESLQHHGILGQRWGYMNGPPYPLSNSQRTATQRKLNPVSESIKNMQEKSEAKKAAKEAAEKELAYKKNYKNMSDEEMRTLISRARLEKEYSDLVLPKDKQNGFKKTVSDALKTIGNKTVNEVVIPLAVAKIKNSIITWMEATGRYSSEEINTIRRAMNMAEGTGISMKNVLDADLTKMSPSDVKKVKEITSDMVAAKNNRESYMRGDKKTSDVDFAKLLNISNDDLKNMDAETVKSYAQAASDLERYLGSVDRISKKNYSNPNNQNNNNNNSNDNNGNQQNS